MNTPIIKCKIEGCEKNKYGRGWCQMHYYRWKRHGSPHLRLTRTWPKCSSKKEYERMIRQDIKDRVIMYYSNHTSACCKCMRRFDLGNLTIHHIHGKGKIHREKVGFGYDFYRWLIKNKFPDGYAVMCWSCNLETNDPTR